MVAPNEKNRSLADASGATPSSRNAVSVNPPMAERSATTVSPVLAGVMPGTTATVSSVEPPTGTDPGLARPDAVGFVVDPVT